MFYANKNEQSLLLLFVSVSISISMMNKHTNTSYSFILTFLRYFLENWSSFNNLKKWFGWLFKCMKLRTKIMSVCGIFFIFHGMSICWTLVQAFNVHLFCIIIDYWLLEHSEWLQTEHILLVFLLIPKGCSGKKFPSDRDSTSSNWRCNAMLENETKNTPIIEWKKSTKFI